MIDVRGVDVPVAAFAALNPTATVPMSPGSGVERCGRCGADPEGGAAASSVVSRSFTAYDGWAESSAARRVCRVCAWMFTEPLLRSSTYVVVIAAEPELRVLDAQELGVLLSRPVDGSNAVVVPLRGRKHVLPWARWGAVAVDEVAIGWGRDAVAATGAMRRLRGAGFGVRALAAAAPPFALMRNLSGERYTEVLSDWGELDRWRNMGPHWEVMVRASGTANTSEETSRK